MYKNMYGVKVGLRFEYECHESWVGVSMNVKGVSMNVVSRLFCGLV